MATRKVGKHKTEKMKTAHISYPPLTFKIAQGYGKLIEKGLDSENEEVRDLARAAQHLGRVLTAELEKSPTQCASCLYSVGTHYGTKRNKGGDLGWCFFCSECKPLAMKNGYVFGKR